MVLPLTWGIMLPLILIINDSDLKLNAINYDRVNTQISIFSQI